MVLTSNDTDEEYNMNITNAIVIDPTILGMAGIEALPAEMLEPLLVDTATVKGDYREIYKHLSHATKDVTDFDVVGLTQENDAIYVDGEGLLTQPKSFMSIEGYGNPLAGKGLILGGDQEGGSINTSLTPEWVFEKMAFGHLNVSYTRERGLEVLTVHHLVHWKRVLPWLSELDV